MFAGDVSDCEEVKGEKKGLYGLCIAYWNTTNAKARAKILGNFEKNAGEGGPGMPGLDGPECDCWTPDHVVDAFNQSELSLVFHSCNSDGTGVELANFEGNVLTFFTSDSFCFFVHPEDAVAPTDHTSPETELTCRAGIQEIILELTGNECLL